MVYNQDKNTVNISRITLAGGSGSVFRVNIDGSPQTTVYDVEIPGKDSLYIFIRAQIDPNNSNNPLIIKDSVLFEVNGNMQDVDLIAWGQNAFFHVDDTLRGQVVWDKTKPHVIYGHLVVDSASSLEIMAGNGIYFHQKAYLSVRKEATLKVSGTLQYPVLFLGDRLDDDYLDVPGQWDGIYLERGSQNHAINYAVIRNATNGIVIDSTLSFSEPALHITNTIIENVTGYGLYAYATYVTGNNLVIDNCGRSALAIEKGGFYDFRQMTIGNFWNWSVRSDPSLYISNYTYSSTGDPVVADLQQAYFGNCIVYGFLEDEIRLEQEAGAQFNYRFDHALLKTTVNISDPVHFAGILTNEDPLFVNRDDFNFALDTLSPAINKGIPMGVAYDLKGIFRDNTPDLGAYEYMVRW